MILRYTDRSKDDAEWIKIARRRLAELRSGSVSPIPGDEFFAKIRERFGTNSGDSILNERVLLKRVFA